MNLGSPKQLQVVLFDELNMPKTKRTKTGYTTDADALVSLHEQTGHPFLTHLLRHRDVTRLKTTVEGLRKAVSDDGRIHTTYQQTVAATGRLSSTEPNLQNIPIRTDEGRLIRARVHRRAARPTCCSPPTTRRSRCGSWRHLSEDAGLIEAFNSGEDLHTVRRDAGVRVAGRAGHPGDAPADQGDVLRAGLRAVGVRPVRPAEDLASTTPRSRWRPTSPGSAGCATTCGAPSRRPGRTATPRRSSAAAGTCPDLTSDNRQKREMAERAALNAPIQGSAADIIKVAMLGVQRRIEAEGLRSRMLLQVHDELVCEVVAGEQEAMTAVLREEMAGAYPLSVPLEVSVGSGVELGRRRALTPIRTPRTLTPGWPSAYRSVRARSS